MPATKLRHKLGGTLPKDFAPSQLPANTDGNNNSDSHNKRASAKPNAKAETVPAMAVAKISLRHPLDG